MEELRIRLFNSSNVCIYDKSILVNSEDVEEVIKNLEEAKENLNMTNSTYTHYITDTSDIYDN